MPQGFATIPGVEGIMNTAQTIHECPASLGAAQLCDMRQIDVDLGSCSWLAGYEADGRCLNPRDDGTSVTMLANQLPLRVGPLAPSVFVPEDPYSDDKPIPTEGGET